MLCASASWRRSALSLSRFGLALLSVDAPLMGAPDFLFLSDLGKCSVPATGFRRTLASASFRLFQSALPLPDGP